MTEIEFDDLKSFFKKNFIRVRTIIAYIAGTEKTLMFFKKKVDYSEELCYYVYSKMSI